MINLTAAEKTTLKKAYNIALRDLKININPDYAPLFNKRIDVINAGADYPAKWTRDASINVHFGAYLFYPEEAKNTILASIDTFPEIRIGGEFWDAVIFSLGAWQYFLYTDDKEFLTTCFEALKNSLVHFEKCEYDAEYGLFTGPAVYGDGISCYDDKYIDTVNASDNIFHYKQAMLRRVHLGHQGYTMKVLSTNCVYMRAYEIAKLMSDALGVSDPSYSKKAEELKNNIMEYFYDKQSNKFKYYFDEDSTCFSQETLGLAFLELFDICPQPLMRDIIEKTYSSNHGVPVLYPNFERYKRDKNDYGRHCGTVWPHAQAYFALAAKKAGCDDVFKRELLLAAENALRFDQFYEIYHPDTGEIYGGWQEKHGGYIMLNDCRHQTWSATGFIAMILHGLCGIPINDPKEFKKISLNIDDLLR